MGKLTYTCARCWRDIHLRLLGSGALDERIERLVSAIGKLVSKS